MSESSAEHRLAVIASEAKQSSISRFLRPSGSPRPFGPRDDDQVRRLSDLCALVTDQVHPADVPEAVYLGLEHLTPGRLRPSGGGRAKDVQSHKFSFRRGDVLYGKLRPYLDKAVLAESDGVSTTELLVLRAKPGVDPHFVACVVHAPDFINHSMAGVTGAHHPHTSWAHIAQFEIPRLTPDEQTAIARLAWRIGDLLQACENTLEAVQDLKRAAMRELFTRGLRGEAQKETEIGLVPESWGVARLGEVCQLSTGTTPSTKRPDYYEGDVPFIKTSEIVNNRLTDTTTFVSRQAVADYSLRIYPAGTVLMAMYGQGKTRGQVALLEMEATTTKNAAALQPSAELDPAFLWYYLLGNYERLRAMGSLGHLSHLNLGYLRELLVVKPSIPEQHEIVAILDALDRKIDLHRRKRSVLEELFKALLHKLMTGEIRVADLDLSALDGGSG